MTTDYVYPKDTFIDCQDRPRSLSVRLFTSVGAMVVLSWIPRRTKDISHDSVYHSAS